MQEDIINNNSNFFELLINTNPDLICRYTLDKKIEFINDSIYVMTGILPSDFINKSIHEFGYPPEFINEFEKGFDECVNTKEKIKILVNPEVGPLANKFFDIQFLPIIDSVNTSKIIGVFTVSRDITEQKKLEFLQAQQIKDLSILSQRIITKANKLQNFAHIVSHNLRAPASGITALTNLLENAVDKQDEQKIISMLKLSANRLSQTIEDLSQTVKINENVNVEIEELEFSIVANHIKESLASLLLESGAIISEDYSACSSVNYHKVYLESIFHNLIANAIKYKHPARKPLISIKTEIDKKGVIKLSCSDNGIGIDLLANAEKIFGLHQTFHGNKDARGLGLFITKNQVEALGGKISVTSEVGVGTTFYISFN